MTRRPGTVALLAVFAFACHTDPFVRGYEGSSGPLTSGADGERLTFADTNEDSVPFRASAPAWAANGRGIIYSFSPRPYLPGEKKLAQRCYLNHPCRPIALDRDDACLAMLPPTGGSAYWNICESRSGHSSTTDIIAAGDVNAAGELLYVESVDPAPELAFPLFPPPPPSGSYADLWLAPVERPLDRRNLCRFYMSGLPAPLPPAPPCGVGQLSDIQWSGAGMFMASTGASLVQARISGDGVSIAMVPGTEGLARYALVDANMVAIFIGPDLAVRRIGLAGGDPSVIAVLPLGSYGRLLDIGCHPDVCVVLARDGYPVRTWSLWKVDVATGAVVSVRTFYHPVTGARLSPVSGDVVAAEGGSLFLLHQVVP